MQDRKLNSLSANTTLREEDTSATENSLIVAKKAELQQQLYSSSIKEGDIVEGTVKNVTDFGAFIDLGGADGLLHISEMSWGRVEHPKKVFKVGDKVKVLIKEISGT